MWRYFCSRLWKEKTGSVISEIIRIIKCVEKIDWAFRQVRKKHRTFVAQNAFCQYTLHYKTLMELERATTVYGREQQPSINKARR